MSFRSSLEVPVESAAAAGAAGSSGAATSAAEFKDSASDTLAAAASAFARLVSIDERNNRGFREAGKENEIVGRPITTPIYMDYDQATSRSAGRGAYAKAMSSARRSRETADAAGVTEVRQSATDAARVAAAISGFATTAFF